MPETGMAPARPAEWSDLRIAPRHAEWLAAHAITPTVAAEIGVYSIASVDDLPDGCGWVGDRGVPGIVFPWRSPYGEVRYQLHPDVPIPPPAETPDERPAKYVWPKGAGLVLSRTRAVSGPRTVLLVEGTKQPLAAAGYAPPGVDVYGMHGCRGWLQDGVPLRDLEVVDGLDVIVLMDGDVARNPDVHEAAGKLADACRMNGAASVRYILLPSAGTAGLDDVLGRATEEKRAGKLGNLIAAAVAKLPAKPTKKTREPRVARIPDDERPMVNVEGDRLDVINALTRALLGRWDGRKLFNHGEVLSLLVERDGRPSMAVLGKDSFNDLVQQTCRTAKVVKGPDGDEQIVYCWPDGQSLGATLSRSSWFAPLDQLAQAPFVRPDGSVCQANGYDADTRTMVVMDEALSRIVVPEAPTPGEVELARKLLVEDWLGDFPFPSPADRANALALVLTPFVRGHMPVAPLAVVDGLAPGVGKGLLAECVTTLVLGSRLEPLPYNVDDEEQRKVITSAFRTSAEVFVFDEAHTLKGASLARALTASHWKDRQLSTSQMLGFPNRVTWISLGNNVRIEGDIFRRVYRIALRPDVEAPEDRPLASFRHPDLIGWTMANRAELLTAALTLVRAWYADGCPAPTRPSSFGSFEVWERVLGGILERAGQPGFLGNLKQWRAASNLDHGYWAAHLRWLRSIFGDEGFTSGEVRQRLIADLSADYPPNITVDRSDPVTYPKALGEAYHRQLDRTYDGLRLRRDGQAHGGRAKWRIESNGGETATDGCQDPMPEGSGGTGGTSYTPAHVRKNSFSDAHNFPACETGGGAPSGPSGPSEAAESHGIGTKPEARPEGGTPPGPSEAAESHGNGRRPARKPHGTGRNDMQTDLLEGVPLPYTSVDVAGFSHPGTEELPPGVLVFDIETGGEQIWPARGDFVRLTGYQLGATVRATTDPAEAVRLIEAADLVVGHNIMSFDLVALAVNHGLDILRLAEEGRVVDTMLTEILNNPPAPGLKPEQILKAHALDRLAAARFGTGKTLELKALAKEFGGFDRIPQDEERYVTYCATDVDITARLARTQPRTAYARREHRVAAIAARMRMNGFRVDLDVLAERVAAGHQRSAELIAGLVERYDLPTVKKDGKPSAAPHRTAEGRAKLVAAFEDMGVALPTTPKGEPSLGGDGLEALAEQYAGRPDVLALIEPIQALNGVRSVYDTVETYRRGDRVHPEIAMVQASGRWSVTKPGLTVFGKRGGRHVEREIFLPEPGHVLIAADLAQVDARAVAAWCQDPAYLDLFEPGRDSHTEIALAVWGDESRRQDAKVIGHGWNYGMGLRRLAETCGSEVKAREYDRTMRERFPLLVAWKFTVAEQGEADLLDNGFGRKLRCEPGRAWTQAPALVGQSAARDILMEGLLRLPVEVHPYLRAVVHDEVVLSVPADQADDIGRVVVEALSFPWAPRPEDRPVQIVAGLAAKGRTWGHVYEKE